MAFWLAAAIACVCTPARASDQRPVLRVPGEVIVRLRTNGRSNTGQRLGANPPGPTPAILVEAFAKYGGQTLAPVFRSDPQPQPFRSASSGPDLSNVYLLEVAPETDLDTLVADLYRSTDVEWAEPNRIYQIALAEGDAPALKGGVNAIAEGVPYFNDPYFASSSSWGQPFRDLWGVVAIGAPFAWQVTQGAGVTVAVIDTGVDISHPDLHRNRWRNADEVSGNRVDDDNNGFVDDLHGWDFTHCVASPNGRCVREKRPGRSVRDRNGHGTHIAGIIAAVGANRRGIVGVAPLARIMALKALDDSGNGSTADIAAAIEYATDNGASVINASFTGEPSELMQLAIQHAHARGVVVVAAAGNAATSIHAVSPANLPDVIAVGASDTNEHVPAFSNFGKPLALVAPGGGDTVPMTDMAPGASILSVFARRSNIGRSCTYEPVPECDPSCPPVYRCRIRPVVIGRTNVRAEGTSMSAAFVSGVAALVRSKHPSFTRDQVRQVLTQTATDLGPTGWDRTAGYGRVDARAAVGVDAIPVAQLAPIDNEKVQEWQWPFTLHGKAIVPDGRLDRWTLQVRETGNPTVLLEEVGREDVLSGPLAVLDGTQFERGKRYTVELVVADTTGSLARDTQTFLVPDHKFVLAPLPDVVARGQEIRLSGDGSKVLVTRTNDPGSSASSRAWLFDAQENLARRLTVGDASYSGWLTRSGSMMSFLGPLPDGSYCGTAQISLLSPVVFGAETNMYHCLPAGVNVGGDAAVDASGKRTVFVSNGQLDSDEANPERRSQLFLYDEDEGRIRQLTRTPPGPSGSLDVIAGVAIDDAGETITFDSSVALDPNHSFEPSHFIRHVFVYDERSQTFHQITGIDSAPPDGECASLSRDGKTIAFKSTAGLMVGGSGGGTFQQIVDSSIESGCPLLSGDGSAVIFRAIADLDPTVGNEDFSNEIFRFEIASGTTAQMTDTVGLPSCARCGTDLRAVNDDGTVAIVDTPFSPRYLPLPLISYLTRAVPIDRQNRPPALTVPESVEIATRATTRIGVLAADPDGNRLTFVVHRIPWSAASTIYHLARFALDDHGDGSADLVLTPKENEIGEYTIRVAAFDDKGAAAVKDLRLVIRSGGS